MMMFEHKSEPLLPVGLFLLRVLRSFAVGVLVIGIALGVGVIGYRVSGGLSWLDAFYNASMILGGMGPVDSRPVVPDAEKVFASLYALFAGVAFLVIVGVMFAPVYHRFMHRFHLELEEDD
jgi:hypothetical protein